MQEWLPVLFSAGSVLVALGCALYMRLSGPISTRRFLVDLSTRVDELQASMEDVGLRWEKYRQGVEGLVEELQQTEERVERGRRKTSQAAARLKRGENGEKPAAELDEHGQLLMKARALGIPV